MDRIRLHPLAAQQVKELRDKWGVECDLDDVVWLHELASRVTRPMGAPHEGLAGAPVQIGNLTLWPLTIGASEWVHTMLAMFPDGKDSVTVVAYGMAKARSPVDLPAGMRYRDAQAALRAFRRSLGVTHRELMEAISVLSEREPKAPPKTTTPPDATRVYRDLIAALCKAYPATTPDYWRWGTSRCEALDMLAAYNKQLTTRGERLSKGDPAALAFDALIAARAQIIKEHRERAAA